MPTLLIADDSKTSQMLLSGVLRRLPGFEVLAVDDGQAALEVIRDRPVALLVTDIHMPGLDGVELVREVRRLRDSASLPIVMVTARGDERGAEGLRLGADALLTKPVSRSGLAAIVERLLAPALALAPSPRTD
jgi:CheY-like chemotaxis protein